MTIKSFRGLIKDGGIDTIPLSTNDGSVGYKVVKFEIMTNSISAASVEHTVQIFKIPQAEESATQVIDFSDPTLFAAAVTMSRMMHLTHQLLQKLYLIMKYLTRTYMLHIKIINLVKHVIIILN